jgi:hypothetical protein
MSLQIAAVDRMFERLAMTYGAQWIRHWEGVPITDVKTAWAHELAGYAGHLKTIAWALENLPERCPNLIEFRNLCRQAPAAPVPALPLPAADPQRVARELEKLGPLRVQQTGPQNPKAWAHHILARKEAGEKVNPSTLAMARRALGQADGT